MISRRILFWNMGGRDRSDVLGRIASHVDADIAIVAECGPDVRQIAGVMRAATGSPFHHVRSTVDRIVFLTRIPRSDVRQLQDDPSQKFMIFRVYFGTRDILIAMAHLRSRLFGNESISQSHQVTHLADAIRDEEDRVNHQRTVLVGDLNMNPFDEGAVSARCLHGVPTAVIARRGSRTVEGRAYPFFYNPMWSCFGDRSEGPPGTYYFRNSTHLVHFWNIFDQVLVRPALIEGFEGPTIVESDGSTSLLTSAGLPDRRFGSDHLPICFRVSV